MLPENRTLAQLLSWGTSPHVHAGLET